MTLARGKAPANFVPAAAVIRKERALIIMIGFKGFVDGINRTSVKDKDIIFGSAEMTYCLSVSKVGGIPLVERSEILSCGGMSEAKAAY